MLEASAMETHNTVSLSPTQAVNWQGQPLYDSQGQPITVAQLQEMLVSADTVKDLTKKDGVALTQEEGQSLKDEFIQWMASQNAEPLSVQSMVAQTPATAEVVDDDNASEMEKSTQASATATFRMAGPPLDHRGTAAQ